MADPSDTDALDPHRRTRQVWSAPHLERLDVSGSARAASSVEGTYFTDIDILTFHGPSS
jgi:hypothetical protein